MHYRVISANITDNYTVRDVKSCINIIKNISNIDWSDILHNGSNLEYPDYTIKYLTRGHGGGYIYLVKHAKCGTGVLKIIDNYKYKKVRARNSINKCHIKGEIYYSLKCKYLIEKNICPGFLYSYYAKYTSNYTYIFSEYVNESVKNWIKTQHTHYEWMAMLFQVLYALYCFHTVLDSYHGDLHIGNIFYKNIDPDIVFSYKIKNKTYNIATNGVLFMIADYGQSFICNNITNETKNIYYAKDLHKLLNINIYALYYNITKIYTMDDIKQIIYKNNDKYFDNYLASIITKYSKIPEKPEYFNYKIEKLVIMYCIEKKYITYTDIINMTPEYNHSLLPQSICTFLDNIKSHNLTILQMFELFYVYFTENNIQSTNTVNFSLS